MMLELINKILMVLLCLASLNTARHAYYFIQTLVTSSTEEPTKYRLSNKSLFLLGLSIAYVLATIFTGTKI